MPLDIRGEKRYLQHQISQAHFLKKKKFKKKVSENQGLSTAKNSEISKIYSFG